MKIEIKNNIIKEIATTIKGTIYENKVFVVGGFVRDLVMGNKPKDIDLLIDGDINSGIEFAEWFCKEKKIYKQEHNPVIYGLYGTAMFNFMNEKIESVAPRSEKYKNDSRNPEVTSCSIEDDALRRDFTINSLFINISTNELLDYTNHGINDIKNKIIRTCGDPDIIFNDDSLRILRMVRFASRYGFDIEMHTLECAKDYVDRLDIISKERITDEFTKMMTFSRPSAIQSMCLLHDLKAFKYIIPDLYDLDSYKLMEIIDDFKQTIDYFKPNIIVILTKLLRYAYELNGYSKDKNNYIKRVLQTVLMYPNDITNEVIFLTKMNDKLHELCTDVCIDFEERKYEVRRIMNLCGNEDRFWNTTVCGSKDVYYTFHNNEYDLDKLSLDELSLFEEFSERDTKFYDYKLPIDGEDVMRVFNIEPSPKVKKILDRVFTFALINTDKTSRKDCLDYLTYLKQIEDNGWLEC